MNVMPDNSLEWSRLQSWLQEAELILDYCTRLAIAMRTGDVEGAMGHNPIFLMQYDADSHDDDESLIRARITNIGKLASAGWETNSDFPIFALLAEDTWD